MPQISLASASALGHADRVQAMSFCEFKLSEGNGMRAGGPIAVLITVLPLAAGIAADRLTDDERRYLTAIAQSRDAQIDSIRQKIDDIRTRGSEITGLRSTAPLSSRKHGSRQNPKPGTKAYREMEAAQQEATKLQISPLEAEIADLESGKTVVEPFLFIPNLSKPGSIVRWHSRIKVLQVIGPSDMRVTFDSRHIDQSWWLTGFPTKNYADDQVAPFDELVVVDGTKTYATAIGGSRTVFVLRPLKIDREKVLAEYRAVSKPAPPKVDPQPESKPVARVKPADPEADARKRFGGLLSNSRGLIKAGMRGAAEKTLKRIVSEVPGTSIAAEAQNELDQLEGGR
jgi:hypothetical protein